MDDAGSRSLLFLVVSRTIVAPQHTSIIRLETPVLNHEYAYSSDVQVFKSDFSAHIPDLTGFTGSCDVQVFKSDFSAHIPDLPGFTGFYRSCIWWATSPPPASSTEDLYILPDWADLRPQHVGTFPGLIFNLSTKKCKIIKAPLAPKCAGYAVTMGDHIYFMSQGCKGSSPAPSFERCDTLSQSWEELEPLPLFGDKHQHGRQYIIGTAVLDDTILFNMDSCIIWAYNAGRNKWYTVNVLNNTCYDIIKGESVVLNKSIYAINGESVVQLTLSSQENNGDLVFTCDLHKKYVVPGLLEIKLEWWDSYYWDRRLVHLGEDNFCVVQCCDGYYGENKNQVIQITYIEVSEKRSIVTNICLHVFKLPVGDLFQIRRCFSMPKCKTTALKVGTRFNPEHEAEIVTLPLELLTQSLDKYSSRLKIIAKLKRGLDFEQGGSVSQSSHSRDHAADTTPEVQEDVPKKSSASVVAAKSNVPSKPSTISAGSHNNSKSPSATKASTLGDGAASGRSNTDEEGHSICVRNLPLDFKFGKLLKALKKFGPIKSSGIHTDYSHTIECRLIDVEFESVTSKQNAIKVSTITTGGLIAVIENKRGAGLSQGDSNSTSGSNSSGSNKINNHGEDSRSKTTSGGHYARKKSHTQPSSKGASLRVRK